MKGVCGKNKEEEEKKDLGVKVLDGIVKINNNWLIVYIFKKEDLLNNK